MLLGRGRRKGLITVDTTLQTFVKSRGLCSRNMRIGSDELQDFAWSADEVTLRQIYMLPIGHRWTSRKGFTLIGDATHLITPFAGEGVNEAMLDALELAHKIIASTQNDGESSLATAVGRFEQGMFERAGAVVEGSRRNREFMFRDDAPGGPIGKVSDPTPLK